MPVPVAIPLSQLLGTASTGAALGKPTEETTPSESTIPFSNVLARQFFGPSSSMLQRTIDTPSGKVFAPDDPIPAKPNILATYPQSKDQPWIMGSPMPAGEPQGIMGLPMPEAQDKLKGFEKPQDVDTNVLMNELTPENLQKQIKYKKNKINSNILDAYLEGKKIAEIEKNEDYKQGNAYNYKISWVDKNNEINADDTDMGTGLNQAKYITSVGFINSIKEKEKEYLNTFINAVENKDYETFDKIRNYDFEDSSFRSQTFKDTLIKYIPKVVDLHRQEAINHQKAVEETLNKTSNPVGSLIDKPLSDETN
jgi:hypothetical protein